MFNNQNAPYYYVDHAALEAALNNPIIASDSYKMSHFLQYPEKTEFVNSYIESRGMATELVASGYEDEMVFFGLQAFLKRYLTKQITQAHIDHAEQFAKDHGEPFNREGWEYIVREFDGYLPVSIDAVPEGSVVKTSNVLVQVINTVPEAYWLTSYIETILLRAVWFPCTAATQSREIKKVIAKYMDETAGHRNGIDFMLHDFGGRGANSKEGAQIGGAAHLVSFMGSDTMEAVEWLAPLYHAKMAAFSVPAAEHSTTTTWGGRKGEVESFRNMLDQFVGKYPIVSVVSDSYDIWNAIDNLWGGVLKDEVERAGKMGSKLVIRPDSGDPTTVPVECVKRLMKKFGYTINEQGYKVLPSYIGVLQGDGINIDSIRQILQNLKDAGLSAENVVFGMGGKLIQGHMRDDFKFAMKANEITVDGQKRDVFKDPITDKGKISKRGRLSLIKTPSGYTTIREDRMGDKDRNQLVRYYENGKMFVDYTLDGIRERAKI